ncbi:1,4-alpha-glucan-branching enzyme [Parasponia andersonii]|uniref:1,4-alpha-glucan-branching enzyme n=1 Tax=Parasponia andersonii TaxID=3476 RepID=A0A2P5D2H4_PARAD|nr:1,4-alpha-glucan-branching enzyme [Parasponia andersonii]
MASKNPSFVSFFHLTILLCVFTMAHSKLSGGHWTLLHPSIGISAMHMQLLRNDKVIIFDGLEVGPSNLYLPNRRCVRRLINDDNDPKTTTTTLKIDCTAHSVSYDVVANTYRPLTLRTNTWCSSGFVSPDGTLVQTGGYGDGIRKIRTFTPCQDDVVGCDWAELGAINLADRRWYATNQVLPDGRAIVVGGRQSFSYEFLPKNSRNDVSFYMRFLWETMDPYDENNLYPFLHLLPDGNLFIFANNRSISFDFRRNLVVREFPVIPGGCKRSYPSTGSSVLLPIVINPTPFGSGPVLPEAEVMVCGGSPPGAYIKSNKERVFLPAARSCGRLRVTDPDPKWAMEDMPMPRVMPDMLLLPTGDIIIINGAGNGTAGWDDAVNPVLSPVLYRTRNPPGRRFVVLTPTTIPRMYHSSALLLPGGQILVGGSNPHRTYNFTARPHRTELSLEAYQPHYLDTQYSNMRPSILTVETGMEIISYGQMFSVTFVLLLYSPSPGISVALITPSFSTHSFAMNQRMLVLEVGRVEHLSIFAYKVSAHGPPTSTVAPPGYYMLFVIHAGIPSKGVWVKVQ